MSIKKINFDKIKELLNPKNYSKTAITFFVITLTILILILTYIFSTIKEEKEREEYNLPDSVMILHRDPSKYMPGSWGFSDGINTSHRSSECNAYFSPIRGVSITQEDVKREREFKDKLENGKNEFEMLVVGASGRFGDAYSTIFIQNYNSWKKASDVKKASILVDTVELLREVYPGYKTSTLRIATCERKKHNNGNEWIGYVAYNFYGREEYKVLIDWD